MTFPLAQRRLPPEIPRHGDIAINRAPQRVLSSNRKFRGAGFRVVGMSLDDEGWKVVKPFISTASIPYRASTSCSRPGRRLLILGNDAQAVSIFLGDNSSF
jgi:hypothetical protein